MNAIIVRSSENVTLLGGGKARRDELAEALSHAPRLIAADGGADTALRHGYRPQAVIGDLDSLSTAAQVALAAATVHRIPEQDSTDFDKVLRSVEAPLLLGVGFLGGRVDHQLANMNVLVRRDEKRCILMGKRDLVMASPARLRIDLPPGCRVSLFPMRAVQGRSCGLRWPIDGLRFAPDAAVGTSNAVAKGHRGAVELEFDTPGMLVILPRAQLRAAIDAIACDAADAPAR